MPLLARILASVMLGVLSLNATGPSARALQATSGADEYAVKAAFLYNFCNYVKWPEKAFESETSAFVVAVLGTDPFGDRLEGALADKTVGRHPILIRRVANLESLPASHLLFVAKDAEKHLPALLERTAGAHTLIVADTLEAASRGAAFGFFIEKRRTRFAIHVDALKRAGLECSSELLKLAQILRDRADPR